MTSSLLPPGMLSYFALLAADSVLFFDIYHSLQ